MATDINWPAALPYLLLDPYSVRPRTKSIETDFGLLVRRRKVYQDAPEIIDVGCVFENTFALEPIFRNFYNDELNSGTLSFNAPIVDNGIATVREVTFFGDEPVFVPGNRPNTIFMSARVFTGGALVREAPDGGWPVVTAGEGSTGWGGVNEVSLSAASYTVLDGDGSVAVVIVRSGLRGAVSAGYATIDGTAVAPTNYTEIAGTANWADGVAGPVEVIVPIEVILPVEELESDFLPDWVEASADPRHPDFLSHHEYQYIQPGGPPSATWKSLGDARSDAEAYREYTLSSTIMACWNTVDGVAPYDAAAVAGNYETLLLQYNGARDMAYLSPGNIYGYDDFGYPPSAGGIMCSPYLGTGMAKNTIGWITEPRVVLGDEAPVQLIYAQGSGPVVDPDPGDTEGWVSGGGCYTPPLTFVATVSTQLSTQVRVRRVPGQPPIPGSDLPDWPADPDNFTWNESSGQKYSKEPWSQVVDDYLWLALYETDGETPNMVLRKPLGPVLHVDDPRNTSEFWLEARNAAVLAGDLSGDVNTYQSNGLGDENTYPRYAGRAWSRTYLPPELQFTFTLSDVIGATPIAPQTATITILAS